MSEWGGEGAAREGPGEHIDLLGVVVSACCMVPAPSPGSDRATRGGIVHGDRGHRQVVGGRGAEAGGSGRG